MGGRLSEQAAEREAAAASFFMPSSSAASCGGTKNQIQNQHQQHQVAEVHAICSIRVF